MQKIYVIVEIRKLYKGEGRDKLENRELIDKLNEDKKLNLYQWEQPFDLEKQRFTRWYRSRAIINSIRSRRVTLSYDPSV